MSHSFATLNPKWKIYQYKDSSEPPIPREMGIGNRISDRWFTSSKSPKEWYKPSIDHRVDEIHLSLIENYLPPSVVIDENNDIIQFCGNVSQYLMIPRGKASFNLFKMMSSELSVAIGTALQRARKENQKVYVPFLLGQVEKGFVRITVQPFSDKNGLQNLMHVLFEEDKEQERKVEYEHWIDIQSNVNDHVVELERELRVTQETLQSAIEELETSNEELQSANEELIASNEEMQSINEELQSVNEELISVNSEHELKIQELLDLNNDMDNLLISTQIATVFLDNEMLVKRFTPAIKNVIDLLEVDIGRPIRHINHNINYHHIVEDAEQVLKTLVPVEKEVRSFNSRWYKMKIVPYRTEQNFIKGVVITFVDITEVKAANGELQKLYYAVEQSPNVVTIRDVEGKVEYVNAKYYEQTGYHRDEVLHRSSPFFNLDPQSKTYQEIMEHLRAGLTWSGEMKCKRKNGETFWAFATILPIKNEQQNTIHYLKLAEDITERKNTEELLKRSEMLSAVGELAAGIAHEIRNPLTALKGFIQLMQAENVGNEVYMKIMMREFERIESIITELLILSKPHIFGFENKIVSEVLDEVVLLLSSQGNMRNVQFDCRFEKGIHRISCVPNQLKQVFINITKNAIEAMEEGGTIHIETKKVDDHELRIRFQDEGKGIPQEILERLGEPFNSNKEKGTGLGLMVSYKIIEDHKGKIRVHSEEGKGTTIDITLPTV